MHRRKLALDQKKTLYKYFIQLDKADMSSRLQIIEKVANSILKISVNFTNLPSKFRLFWSKYWLKRQYNLFKIRKKFIAAMYKNAQDPKIMME